MTMLNLPNSNPMIKQGLTCKTTQILEIEETETKAVIISQNYRNV
jgi:hypothetical protein